MNVLSEIQLMTKRVIVLSYVTFHNIFKDGKNMSRRRNAITTIFKEFYVKFSREWRKTKRFARIIYKTGHAARVYIY